MKNTQKFPMVEKTRKNGNEKKLKKRKKFLGNENNPESQAVAFSFDPDFISNDFSSFSRSIR